LSVVTQGNEQEPLCRSYSLGTHNRFTDAGLDVMCRFRAIDLFCFRLYCVTRKLAQRPQRNIYAMFRIVTLQAYWRIQRWKVSRYSPSCFQLSWKTLHEANKKLIRRWDSEREMFYDDIVHVLHNMKITP